MADDIAALLDAHGIGGKVALAGTAVGAGIAIHFAVRHAARAGALVVSSPALGVGGDRRQATLDRAAAAEAKGMRGIVESSLANSYPPVVRHNAEEFRKFRARWLCNDPHSFAAINRMLAEGDLNGELPRIACPTLVIGCTHDKLRPPAVVEALAKQIPGAEYSADQFRAFCRDPDAGADGAGDPLFSALVGALKPSVIARSVSVEAIPCVRGWGARRRRLLRRCAPRNDRRAATSLRQGAV